MGQYRHQTALSPIQGRWHDATYWGLLILACAAFLLMNVLTPYKEDDMGFTLIDGVWTRVHSLADAWQSYRNHLTNTNGRLADLVPTLFAGLLGKGVFNVCNTLVFGLMAHLLSLLCARRRSVMVLAMFLAVVGTCFPIPGETMLWMSGSANYMWAITLSLLLIYYLQRRQGTSLKAAEGILLFFGAIVAGGFNEATSFGFFAGLVLYYAFNRQQIDRRAAIALAGYLIGILIIASSPAAWERATEGDLIINLPLGKLLVSRWNIFIEKAWRFYLPVAALIVGIIALLMKRGRTVKQSVWTYIFIGLTLVMFALGILHERAYAPWVTVAFIIVAIGIDAILARVPELRAVVIFCSASLAFNTFGRGIIALGEYKDFNDEVIEEIEAAPNQAVLYERQFPDYSRFIKPVNFQSDNFFAHEIIYRAYFDKQNVQFVSDSVFVRFHEGRLLDGAHVTKPASDRPDLAGLVYTFDDQDYMAVQLNSQTLPGTFQTARAYSTTGDLSVNTDQTSKHERYGIELDYVPVGFYPIEYQGQCYLICRKLDTNFHKIVFPLTLPPDPEEITIEKP